MTGPWSVARFAERLRQARKAAGLSQAELGERLGVRQATVSGWERETAMPSVEWVGQLAEVLGARMEWLLGLSGDAQPEGAQLTRVRGALRELVASIPGPVQDPGRLFLRAEELRQDAALRERHGALAWLAVAESIAEEWVRAGVVAEAELDLWREWVQLAGRGGELPAVTWRTLGLARHDVLGG